MIIGKVNIRCIIVILLLLIIFAGCSSTKHSSSVLPGVQSDSALTGTLGLKQYTQTDDRNLIGLWEMYADPGGALEAVPIRTGAFHLNARQFVEDPVQNLSILYSRALPYDNIETRIEITHPFDNPNLWGFDVRGICILPGTREYPSLGVKVSDRSLGDPILANAEGYTRLWNPAEFSGTGIFAWTEGTYGNPPSVDEVATVNGYRNFWTHRERHAFEPGTTTSAYYRLSLPGGPLKFTYAIDASWSQPDVSPPSDPDDFPVSANMAEAYRVTAALSPDYTGTGTGALTVDVVDWQGPDTIVSVRYELPSELGGASGELPQSNTNGPEARYRTIVSGNTSSTGGERILVEVTDVATDPHGGANRSYAFARVLEPDYIPWPQWTGPDYNGARRSNALSPMVPEYVGQLNFYEPGYRLENVLIHSGDNIVARYDYHNDPGWVDYITIFSPQNELMHIWYYYNTWPNEIILAPPDLLYIKHSNYTPYNYYITLRDMSGVEHWTITYDTSDSLEDTTWLYGTSRSGGIYTIDTLDAALYIGHPDNIRKINSGGGEDWSHEETDITSKVTHHYPLVEHPNGNIYGSWYEFGLTGYFFALDGNGNKFWDYTYELPSGTIGTSPQVIIGPDGVIYCFIPESSALTVLRFSPSGHLISSFTRPEIFFDKQSSKICMAADGSIITSTYDAPFGINPPVNYSYLVSCDPDGEIRWLIDLKAIDDYWRNFNMMLDASGSIFTNSHLGRISQDADGRYRWLAIEGGPSDNPIMDGMGRIILGRTIFCDTSD